jgi:hypothetical protein
MSVAKEIKTQEPQGPEEDTQLKRLYHFWKSLKQLGEDSDGDYT